MRNYILKRFLFMAITLLVITVVSYTMMRLAPGDPIRAQQIGGERPAPSALPRGKAWAKRSCARSTTSTATRSSATAIGSGAS